MNNNGMSGGLPINGDGMVGYMDGNGNGPVNGNGENVNSIINGEHVFKQHHIRQETQVEKIVKPIIGSMINNHQEPQQHLPPRPSIPNKPIMPILLPQNVSNTPPMNINMGNNGYTEKQMNVTEEQSMAPYNKNSGLYANINNKYDMQNKVGYYYNH